MSRLRLVFVLVAAVVLVPLLLLARRALSSAQAERALESRALADRVVDEMERELTAFLRREEDRPFSHYRHLAVPDDPAAGAALVRSPLADPLPEPFVVGPFQLAPGGEVTTPLRPEDEARAAAVAGASPSAASRDAAARVLAAVRGRFPTRPEVDRDEPREGAKGSTEVLTKAPVKAEASSSSTPYEVLSQLNRAAADRKLRGSKLEQTQGANVAEAEELRPPPVVDVRVEPMVGRRLDEGTMVLYRTVLAGDRAFRQGLVLDVEALVRWLADRALADVGRSIVRVEPDRGDAAPAPGGYVFRHRFAEPFGPAAAIVTIEPAPGLGSVEVVELLTALLVFAATAGLLALYRMAAVAVRYARRRGDFVSAVTHELKTPLTAIRMYGEMLRDGIVPDEARRQRYYETITAEGERLSRLVENVLELARLERREKPPALAVGDVGAVLGEALAVLAPHAEKEGFVVRLDVEPGLPPCRFDRDGLLQVVFNLVDNAIKYSRAGAEKTIEVRARRDEPGVVVTVADRGPGVAPRQLRRIFEPFWRGESELTRTTKGTGIGLALVRGLVARMGGTVSARNGEAGGLEVRVRLAAA
jgi:signal transduction histidine kinase